MERRITASDFEIRAGAGGGHIIEGHAPIWDRYSQNLGGFVEQVTRGATSRTIIDDDIRGLENHDPNRRLGRNIAGTLRLAEDDTGLHYEIDIPDTQVGRDLVVSAERGDISGSSFSFRVIDQQWGFTDSDFPLRTITAMKLYDVGPVTFPAYVDSEAGLRSYVDRREALAGLVSETRSIDQVLAAPDLTSFIGGDADDHDDPGQRATHPGLVVASLRLELMSRRFPA